MLTKAGELKTEGKQDARPKLWVFCDDGMWRVVPGKLALREIEDRLRGTNEKPLLPGVRDVDVLPVETT